MTGHEKSAARALFSCSAAELVGRPLPNNASQALFCNNFKAKEPSTTPKRTPEQTRHLRIKCAYAAQLRMCAVWFGWLDGIRSGDTDAGAVVEGKASFRPSQRR
jgi:hypothetical protein